MNISKVFQIIYTNCPRKRLSGKVTVRETSVIQKIWGDGGDGRCLVRMEWRPAG